MSFLLSGCAIVASLAVGVSLAQGLCVLMFHVFRIHARQVAAQRALHASTVKGLQTLSS